MIVLYDKHSTLSTELVNGGLKKKLSEVASLTIESGDVPVAVPSLQLGVMGSLGQLTFDPIQNKKPKKDIICMDTQSIFWKSTDEVKSLCEFLFMI